MKNKQNKEVYLNEEEIICASSVTSGMIGLCIITILMISLFINFFTFMFASLLMLFYFLLSIIFNLFKFNDLIKKRHNGKKKKGRK